MSSASDVLEGDVDGDGVDAEAGGEAGAEFGDFDEVEKDVPDGDGSGCAGCFRAQLCCVAQVGGEDASMEEPTAGDQPPPFDARDDLGLKVLPIQVP
jgi:hypothetical protein